MEALHFLASCILIAVGLIVVTAALLFVYVLIKGTLYALNEVMKARKK